MTVSAASIEDRDDRRADGRSLPLVPVALRTATAARLAVGDGVLRSELVKDLTPFTSHRLTPASLRAVLDQVLDEFVATAAADDVRGRFKLSAAGRAQLLQQLGPTALPADWLALRDGPLMAVALGVEPRTAPRLRALLRPDGLRAQILVRSFNLPDKLRMSPATMRGELAVVALERAFGNRIKSGVGSGKDLPAKAARLLAAQLCHRPRDPGTDSRLIATLAAEAVGAVQPSAEHLRLAVLKRWIAASIDALGVAATPTAATALSIASTPPSALPEPRPSHREARLSAAGPMRPAAATRPDLEGFARAVQQAARVHAEGWPGSRKAMIARLFSAIGLAHPEWGLSEIEFKSMLAEAHRTGHLVLVTADLKDKSNLKELQHSAVTYKNTVWHLVRVED